MIQRLRKWWTSSVRCGPIVVPHHQEAADRRDQNIRIELASEGTRRALQRELRIPRAR